MEESKEEMTQEEKIEKIEKISKNLKKINALANRVKKKIAEEIEEIQKQGE